MKYKNFEELPIWQNASAIVNIVYSTIEGNPGLQKDLRLNGQLVGASISIMNNIAEGFDAGNNNEFIRFLKYSQRSCSEIMSMSYILNDVAGWKMNQEKFILILLKKENKSKLL